MRPFLAPLSLALLLAACGDGEPLLPPDHLLPDGGRYRGEVVDGLLQGPGRLDYADGSWYQGDFQNGLRQGQGEWRSADGAHYRGDFHQGLFHGQGELQLADGGHYRGGFAAGRFQGEGTLEREGLSYRGEFVDGQYQGSGILERPDGSRHQGRFKAGKPHGQGVRTDPYGNRFSGRFRHGRLHGPGSLEGSDGDSYSGDFRAGQFHGQGRYQSAVGDVWSGQFVEGALSGKGRFKGEDGSDYRGHFDNWSYHGQGRLRLNDGSQYQGHFAHGDYAGRGLLTLADGSLQSGTWQGGVRIRDEQGRLLPDPLELGLLVQGRLLDEAIAALPASTAEAELYALTLAGDGSQSVFMREADYVGELLEQRFAARGRITLSNHRSHLASRPLATRESLRRAIEALAAASGPEDLVFIYLTSHGSREHALSLEQPRLQLNDLPAADLATLLQPLSGRHKVLVISACYSGGFIPALKDAKTLVMTAARADRVSFGCSEENDFTYFGRALFAEALQQTDDLEQAFALAKARVSEREQDEGFEASEPQIWAPKAVLSTWQKLRKTQAPDGLQAALTDKTTHNH